MITAAAIRCLNGYMVGRLVGYTPEQGERMKDMGISDPKRIYTPTNLRRARTSSSPLPA